MRFNCAVTVFRYDEVAEKYVSFVLPRVWVHRIIAVAKEKTGVAQANRVTVRVAMDVLKGQKVFVGDYLFLGKTEMLTPPKAECVKVAEVCENDVGTVPHLRILAR